MASLAILALDGGESKQEGGLGVTDSLPQRTRKLHDPTISFEEYLHYAKEARAWEASAANAVSATLEGSVLKRHFRLDGKQKEAIHEETPREQETGQISASEKRSITEESPKNGSVAGVVGPSIITDDEWANAARAARTVTWGAVFFLLTTDILGPYSAP